MVRVEFHCHTVASKDCLVSPRRLLQACRKKGIDRVAVTDHNTIQGARRAYELDPQRVIIGEEIKTEKGELLAFFVQTGVPAGLPVLEAIARLQEQNAFISLAHPMDPNRNGGWTEADLEALLPYIDAIETFNSRCLSQVYNQRAAAFGQRHGLLSTVGSDAHTVFELGRATLLLPDFSDAESLRKALPWAKADCRMSSPLIHLTSRWAVWVKKIVPPAGRLEA